MRDLLSKPKIASGESSVNNTGAVSEGVDMEKKKKLTFVNDEICSSILDISFQRLLRKEKIHPQTSFSLAALELWSDDFEGKGDFGQYRSRLVCFISISNKPTPLPCSRPILLLISYISLG